MSFRWFAYYCSLFGGCGAYVGWALGRLPAVEGSLGQAGVRGLFLGMAVALVLSVVDALWRLAPNQGLAACWRVLVGGLLGGLGGYVGGWLGQVLYAGTHRGLGLVFGWALMGTLIGTAPGAFDLLASLMRGDGERGARLRVLHGALGGAVGGLLGGGLFLLLRDGWGKLLGARADEFWSPSATCSVALGLAVGLLVGLAQVVLKEAWLRVEVGPYLGRELILSKAETTIGKPEACDLGLPDAIGVEPVHARIVCEGGRYLLEPAGSAGDTFLNGAPLDAPAPLRSGDEVRVGGCVLRFGERRKRGPA